jgi:hypothetical protein
MSNFFGGYYLIHLRKFDFGRLKDKTVFTCSDCINDSLFASWSLSWTKKGKDELASVGNDFQISQEAIQDITIWADKHFNEKKLGWINVFTDLKTVKEYRDKFFGHLCDVKIFSIYFPDAEANDIIEKFNPVGNNGTLGICDNIGKRIRETEVINEITIGYDLIGIEAGGEFHSFNCHDIADELIEKFGVTINKYCLIDEQADWTMLTDYMNDDKNGHEPVPWFVCKVKMVLV